MVRASIPGSKGKSTSVTSRMASNMAEASGAAQQSRAAMFMKENTSKTRGMERDSSHGPVEMFTEANIRMRRGMDKDK